MIYFSVLSVFVFGQKALNYELTNDSDTLHYYKYEKPIVEKLNLLKPEGNSNFFRFSSDKYYLELSEISNKYLIYADEIWDNSKTGEVFIREIKLNESQVYKINKLIDSLKINDIPSDNRLKEWTFGFDGITYKLENKNGINYSYKHYWTPTSQNKFLESDKINIFVTEIDKIIDYKTNREKFVSEVPYFTWTRDGVAWSAVKILTAENYSEYRKYRKLKKKLIKSRK
ncbi:hypothetical protein [Kaistella jeonii]|uniref:Uncharacterized protein n=1 Tax=Kaistella jeonii TaxID=266749 RepID=A0A0C1CJF7_9FLAO|nr:hypothetical protein [Kaistella jeonii]KIA83956.1 hypothetical protein OA86_14960 [Kaistella jeonii]